MNQTAQKALFVSKQCTYYNFVRILGSEYKFRMQIPIVILQTGFTESPNHVCLVCSVGT